MCLGFGRLRIPGNVTRSPSPARIGPCHLAMSAFPFRVVGQDDCFVGIDKLAKKFADITRPLEEVIV